MKTSVELAPTSQPPKKSRKKGTDGQLSLEPVRQFIVCVWPVDRPELRSFHGKIYNRLSDAKKCATFYDRGQGVTLNSKPGQFSADVMELRPTGIVGFADGYLK
jgi:hypothetical protein